MVKVEINDLLNLKFFFLIFDGACNQDAFGFKLHLTPKQINELFLKLARLCQRDHPWGHLHMVSVLAEDQLFMFTAVSALGDFIEWVIAYVKLLYVLTHKI